MSGAGKPNPDHVADWLVERLARNDLPAAEAASVRARLEAEPGGLDRLTAIANSDAEILQSHPTETVAREIRRRLDGAERTARARAGQTRRKAPWLAWALPAAGAAALVVVFALPDGERSNNHTGVPALPHVPPPSGERIKGDARLLVYRQGDRSNELLDAGATVRPGDVLQAGYVGAGKAPDRFGVIASVDAAGTVTLHLPEVAGPAPRLAAAKTLAPHSFELDDSPGFERFVLVTSDRAFSTQDAVGFLAGPNKRLPASITLVDLTLRKESQP